MGDFFAGEVKDSAFPNDNNPLSRQNPETYETTFRTKATGVSLCRFMSLKENELSEWNPPFSSQRPAGDDKTRYK